MPVSNFTAGAVISVVVVVVVIVVFAKYYDHIFTIAENPSPPAGESVGVTIGDVEEGLAVGTPSSTLVTPAFYSTPVVQVIQNKLYVDPQKLIILYNIDAATVLAMDTAGNSFKFAATSPIDGAAVAKLSTTPTTKVIKPVLYKLDGGNSILCCDSVTDGLVVVMFEPTGAVKRIVVVKGGQTRVVDNIVDSVKLTNYTYSEAVEHTAFTKTYTKFKGGKCAPGRFITTINPYYFERNSLSTIFPCLTYCTPYLAYDPVRKNFVTRSVLSSTASSSVKIRSANGSQFAGKTDQDFIEGVGADVFIRNATIKTTAEEDAIVDASFDTFTLVGATNALRTIKGSSAVITVGDQIIVRIVPSAADHREVVCISFGQLLIGVVRSVAPAGVTGVTSTAVSGVLNECCVVHTARGLEHCSAPLVVEYDPNKPTMSFGQTLTANAPPVGSVAGDAIWTVIRTNDFTVAHGDFPNFMNDIFPEVAGGGSSSGGSGSGSADDDVMVGGDSGNVTLSAKDKAMYDILVKNGFMRKDGSIVANEKTVALLDDLIAKVELDTQYREKSDDKHTVSFLNRLSEGLVGGAYGTAINKHGLPGVDEPQSRATGVGGTAGGDTAGDGTTGGNITGSATVYAGLSVTNHNGTTSFDPSLPTGTAGDIYHPSEYNDIIVKTQNQINAAEYTRILQQARNKAIIESNLARQRDSEKITETQYEEVLRNDPRFIAALNAAVENPEAFVGLLSSA